MTDETTARDRAIEVIEDRCAREQVRGIPDMIDALLANPEVLRALAGAPTADVASLRAIAETARRMYAASDAGDQQDAVYASRTLRDLLAAAPEGVDAADELTEAGRDYPGEHGLRAAMRMAQQDVDARAPAWRTVRRLLVGLDERGRELTAAQAAIQRVEEVADELERMTRVMLNPSATAARIRRTLDGDTTEEKR